MIDRLLKELVEFMSPNSAEGQNLSARTTGSLAWRQARGEIGTGVSEQKTEHVFTLTDPDWGSNPRSNILEVSMQTVTRQMPLCH
jgi:peptide-N4-(N-acetyl-beta-glucosaminyl)asparagine amidase